MVGNPIKASDEYLAEAHEEEREKLASVVRYIQQEMADIEAKMPARAAYTEAATEIQRILEENQTSLDAALLQPYFGRIDYLDKDADEASNVEETSRTIYIGISHVPKNDVVSWTTPVAKLWYTDSYEDGYTAPKGYIPTRVDLKRFLRIRDQELKELKDIFRRAIAATVPRVAGDKQLLVEAVSGVGTGDGHLQVIVETIEPHQYESIANTSDKVLVVQGSAGSGKSEIGLHRVAYLLSPHNDIPENERPTPESTLFIGPSKSFLDYAADILPSLGVRENIQETTFGDWVRSRQSMRLGIQPRIWNNLLDKGAVTRFNEKAELFKGSMDMADVLERHVRGLASRARKECLQLGPLVIEAVDTGASRVVIERTEVKREVDRELPRLLSEDLRLNDRRREFIRRIVELVWARSGSQARGDAAQRRRREIEEKHVLRWCDASWKHIDFRREYANLMSSAPHVLELARGTLDSKAAEGLDETSRLGGATEFGDSDVGALTYLDHLLNGVIDRRYRHVVVDEAQDLSPIEFKLLSLSSSNNWFTILGDTPQQLIPYRGVGKWSSLNRVLGRSEIRVQGARTSYRANKHITRFNNRILRLFDQNIPAPIPFERDGHRPEYHRHRTARDMYQSVIDEIDRVRSLDGLRDAKVAILVRDRLNLNRFKAFCGSIGFGDLTMANQESLSESSVIFARIPDVRGLEYDAVIALGVNETFASTKFNQKLLYMATTRAKHYLGLHWFGTPSPILSSIYSGGVVAIDHRA